MATYIHIYIYRERDRKSLSQSIQISILFREILKSLNPPAVHELLPPSGPIRWLLRHVAWQFQRLRSF
jgi:hypothetical protein